jgi:hypothetical protein
MGAELEAAKRYREHAEELRVIAESSKDNVTRKTLLGVAEDYERMARTREKIDRSDKGDNFRGELSGMRGKAKCVVARRPNGEYYISRVESRLPDGNYLLSVNGLILRVSHARGKWNDADD